MLLNYPIDKDTTVMSSETKPTRIPVDQDTMEMYIEATLLCVPANEDCNSSDIICEPCNKKMRKGPIIPDDDPVINFPKTSPYSSDYESPFNIIFTPMPCRNPDCKDPTGHDGILVRSNAKTKLCRGNWASQPKHCLCPICPFHN